MSAGSILKESDRVLPPRKAGIRAPQTFAVTTTADQVDLWNAKLTQQQKGKFYVTIKVIGGNAAFWFKTGPSALSITMSSGYYMANGAVEPFWIDAKVDSYLEYIADAACAIQVTITSTLIESQSGLTISRDDP